MKEMGAFSKESYRESNKFSKRLFSFVFEKYWGMKQLVVANDKMFIQEKHMFQTSRPSFYSEPPSFLLKFVFIKTDNMTR